MTIYDIYPDIVDGIVFIDDGLKHLYPECFNKNGQRIDEFPNIKIEEEEEKDTNDKNHFSTQGMVN